MTKSDGLFNFPYTERDIIIISIALFGYLFRMYLMYSTKDVGNPKLKDWMGIGVLTILCTITGYEMAISQKWEIRKLYIPFAIVVVVAKDVTDWLFLSKDGRDFVIAGFKSFINRIMSNFGYTRKDE